MNLENFVYPLGINVILAIFVLVSYLYLKLCLYVYQLIFTLVDLATLSSSFIVIKRQQEQTKESLQNVQPLAVIRFSFLIFSNSNSGCDSACEVVDIDKIYLTAHIDEILDEDMTSLNTLVLLGKYKHNLVVICYQTDVTTYFKFKGQTNLKTSAMRSDGIGNDENYRLSMAYERLQRIPAIILEEIAPYVKILDISHNEFSNLDFLKEFKQLHSLICDHNNITSSVELPYLPNLELLWLNHCKINELYPWARKLRQSCPNLKYLSLMGNAAAPSYLNGGNFYEYIQYRQVYIFFNVY